jgi:epoxyqueuosine reductase
MNPDSSQLTAPSGLKERVRRTVLAHGFDRAGFAACGPAPDADRLRRWVERGFAGTMSYIERSLAKREDPRHVLEGARTVIAVALHYQGPGDGGGSGGARGRIAAYARGTDYHRVLEDRLRAACASLRAEHSARFRYYADTGPVLERSWARAAGIGWIGKNACAIDPARGSYFFIGVILTTLEIEPDPPAADHCGSCRLCIDACPTAAIVAPYELDARLCLSYLTIENRGPMPAEIEPLAADLIFGCDICQEVCPFNREAATGDPALAPRPENAAPALEELAALDEEGFRMRFPRSAVRRAKAAGFLRNVIVALGNARSAPAAAAIDRLLEGDAVRGDPMLRGTAERAAARAARRAVQTAHRNHNEQRDPRCT